MCDTYFVIFEAKRLRNTPAENMADLNKGYIMGFIKGIGKAIGGIAKMATGLLSPGGIAGKLMGMLGGAGGKGGLGGMLKGLLGGLMGGGKAGGAGFNPMDMISKFLDPGGLLKGLTGAAGQRGLL